MARPKGTVKKKVASEDLPKIKKMAAAGLTINQIASLIDMSSASLERRIRDSEELKAAIAKGRAEAILNVATSAYRQALSGRVPAMTMFYLKCRAGWKETQAIEHTGKDGESLFTSFTDMVKRLGSEENEGV